MRLHHLMVGLLLSTGCSKINVIPSTSDSSILSICDVFSRPNDFQNRVIRVSAIYFGASEASAIGEQKCGWKAWVRFEPASRADSKQNLVDQLLHISDAGDQKVQVTLVGKLVGPKPPINTNGVVRKLGYGHLGAYEFEFSVLAVEKMGVPYSAYR